MNTTQDGLKEDLHRGLEERHVELISLGGAIGVGLFLGSASAIRMAGPSILLTYLVAGLIMYLIMRSLGEMLLEYPVSGSFSTYASKFIGPIYGYLTGWTYWFMMVVVVIAEMTAIAVYVRFWYPSIPQWIPALVALTLLIVVNLIAVKLYGEFEFWFALIKVVAIIAMIICGGSMILFGFGNGGVPIGISNLWYNGGFFPNGIMGPVKASIMVAFAYLGTEIIGVTAGEAKNPEKTIPSATNKVFWRILIFYVGALFVILSIYPWNKVGIDGSPFVLTFSKLGIKSAAGIINFVVLTAALSSCNTAVFSTGRMLYNLSLQGTAPKVFSKLSKSDVPANGILVTAVFMFLGVILNYAIPNEVFGYVTSIAASGACWLWSMIIISQMRFRKQLNPAQVSKLKFPSIMYPYSNMLCLGFIALITIVMLSSADTRIPFFIGIGWFTILIVYYYSKGLNKTKVHDNAGDNNSNTSKEESII